MYLRSIHYTRKQYLRQPITNEKKTPVFVVYRNRQWLQLIIIVSNSRNMDKETQIFSKPIFSS